MMIVLEPTYTLRVVIKDKHPTMNSIMGLPPSSQQLQQYSQFPNQQGLTNRKFYNPPEIGTNKVYEAVKKALSDAGLEAELWFERFEHS